MSDHVHTIYGIVDFADEVRYVGTTTLSMRKRMNVHWYYRGKKSSPVSQWLSTLSEKPSYIILETNVSDDEAVSRETMWIERYGLDSLLNVGFGGRGGDRWNDEQRKRLVEKIRSPDMRQKNREAQLGRTHSNETRRIIGNAHRGRRKSARQREAMQRWYEEDTRISVRCDKCGRTYRGRRGLGIHQSKAHRTD